MNIIHRPSHAHNPFSEKAFWGRNKELQAIGRYLLSEAPRCCAIIGEDTFGKTTLLQYLSTIQETCEEEHSALSANLMQLQEKFVFIYLDCASYGDEAADLQDFASARFWWDLYQAALEKLPGNAASDLTRPRVRADEEYIDTALMIRWELEDLLQNQEHYVAFILDNFEGIANLPLRDSEWLRSLAKVCTYIAASRDLLYLHYHSSSRSAPSPLWNLFGDPIYLQLPSTEDVEHYLSIATEKARAKNSYWIESDIEYIRKMAGRHPELLRIACSSMYEYRLKEKNPQADTYSPAIEPVLDYRIENAVGPICMQVWLGLARPELRGEQRAVEKQKAELSHNSQYQQAFIDIAKSSAGAREASILVNVDAYEKQILLFDLQRRDLVTFNGSWHIFSEAMRRFVLKQAPFARPITLRSISHENRQRVMPALTHQEKKVYDYLLTHRGTLCLRDDIKLEIWPADKQPTHSALQKIIERIREKIEIDPLNPHYLIAVRGKGYILRAD